MSMPPELFAFEETNAVMTFLAYHGDMPLMLCPDHSRAEL